jgi:hypothetical protein
MLEGQGGPTGTVTGMAVLLRLHRAQSREEGGRIVYTRLGFPYVPVATAVGHYSWRVQH